MAFIERMVDGVTGTIATLAGTTQTVHLPREHFFSRLFLRGVHGNSTTDNYVAAGEQAWVTNIQVTINGQLTVKNYSWLDLYDQNRYLSGTSLEITALTAATTGGYTTNIVEFGVDPYDVSCLMPSHLLSTFDLSLTFSAAATLGGDTASTYALYIGSRELVNEGQDSSKLFINKETTHALTPTATGINAAGTLQLPIGNLYRRFFFRADGGAATDRSNTVIDDMNLIQDGSIVHRDTKWLMERFKGHAEYGVPAAERVVGTLMCDLDHTEDLSQCVDSAPFSTWKWEFDIQSVAQTVAIRVIPQELIPPQ